VRSFAPWELFGFDPLRVPPCVADCFLGNNRSFSTSTDPVVTSKINGIVNFLLPGLVIVNT
jgi:hypothetical protein